MNGCLSAVLLMLLMSSISPARAASQDECSIWLCLPGGFPSGCEGARNAMVNRVKHHQSPLPDWSECSTTEDQALPESQLAYSEGFAAYVPPHRICERVESRSSGSCGSGRNGGGSCQSWQVCTQWSATVYPEAHFPGAFCNVQQGADGEVWKNQPAYCTKTQRYRVVLENGQPIGEPYYEG